jgi:predicted lactoylglutathione lyase
MSDISFVILYVADVQKSEAFFAEILGRPARESSPGFAMFVAAPGVMLGLWRADAVTPKSGLPGGGEICLTLDSAAAVDALCEQWRAKGIEIAQEPTRLDFGHAFVGLDPDGHRVRAFTPAG